jgi:hypothetical protein
MTGLTLALLLGAGSGPGQPGFIAGAAAAEVNFTFYFDELGDGLIDLRNGMGLQPLRGSLMDNPSWAGHPSLTFLLPQAVGLVLAGDIGVRDPGVTTLSDGLRFTDASGSLTGQTANRMIFYSADMNRGLPADTGLPPNFSPLGFAVEESGPAGNFTFRTGGPGSTEYHGSMVPEPSTLLMAGIGAGFGLLWSSCRRRRTANSRD